MTSFDQILKMYRDTNPYRADVLVEMETRFNVAKALMLKMGSTNDFSSRDTHSLIFEYYDRLCDALDGELDEENNLSFGSDN